MISFHPVDYIVIYTCMAIEFLAEAEHMNIQVKAVLLVNHVARIWPLE